MVGVIAVALTEKKEEQLNESTTFNVRPSLILFYSFSDPSNPQVWKVYERVQDGKEIERLNLSLSLTACKQILSHPISV